MCGIFGVFGKATEEFSSNLLYQSFEKIRERGPDRSITVHNSNAFIGFHRLAINGLAIDGDQPFHLVDGDSTYYIVCNGEIYNFRELIDEFVLPVSKNGSDCAVILPLFKKLGYDIDRLNKALLGEYSFAIICFQNELLESVTVCTDPMSVRPVFIGVSADNQSLGISSLLGGLSDLFDHVYRLQQKSILSWKPGLAPETTVYWPSLVNPSPNGVEWPDVEIYKRAVEVFEAAVNRRLIADRPIGCLLSGGLDSSLVCAVAARILSEKYPGKKLKAFSIGMKHGTDIAFAEKVAEHINRQYGNLEHTVIYFTPEEGLTAIDDVIRVTETYDITTIRASVGQYLIGKYIRENTDVKVVLNGDGADEGQMGYLYFFSHPTLLDGQMDHYRLLDEIHLFDGLRVDRAISCHGLEARVPFLDREVVDFFRKLPARWKAPTPERIEKHFIRTAFAEHYGFEEVLPKEVLWRKKEAFSDGVSTKEKSWFQYIQEHLDRKVSDEAFEEHKHTLHPSITPPTKEAFYYMFRFKELFGARWNIIPHYWLPKWSGNIQEPSARVLGVYKK